MSRWRHCLASGLLLAALPLASAAAEAPARASRSGAVKAPAAPEQARQYLRGGRVVEAVDILRAHLQLQPDDVESRRLLLQLLLDGAQFSEAEALLGEALELQPGTPDFCRVLASLQGRRGEPMLALASLRRSASFGQHAGDLAFAGQLARQAGLPGQAREYLERALRAGPPQAHWKLALASLCVEQGDKACAAAQLEGLSSDAALNDAERLYARELLAISRLP